MVRKSFTRWGQVGRSFSTRDTISRSTKSPRRRWTGGLARMTRRLTVRCGCVCVRARRMLWRWIGHELTKQLLCLVVVSTFFGCDINSLSLSLSLSLSFFIGSDAGSYAMAAGDQIVYGFHGVCARARSCACVRVCDCCAECRRILEERRSKSVCALPR